MLRCCLECSTRTEKTVKEIEKRSLWHCCMCPQLLDRVRQFGMTSQRKKLRRKHIKTPVPKVVSNAQINKPFSIISEKFITEKGASRIAR